MAKVPPWAVSNDESVRAEAAPYRSMTPAERLEVLRTVCRTAARQLAAHPLRQKVVAFSDPLPQSSIAALARLRKQARFGD
jgi:hypothetical protein